MYNFWYFVLFLSYFISSVCVFCCRFCCASAISFPSIYKFVFLLFLLFFFFLAICLASFRFPLLCPLALFADDANCNCTRFRSTAYGAQRALCTQISIQTYTNYLIVVLSISTNVIKVIYIFLLPSLVLDVSWADYLKYISLAFCKSCLIEKSKEYFKYFGTDLLI